MHVKLRRQARISALSNRTSPSESDLTDIDDAKDVEKAVLAATVKPTGIGCTNSNSVLSELSDDDADASLAVEQQSGLEQTDEGDSEAESCEYSAYRGSDSEVSVRISKKQPHSVKRTSKVVPRSTEGGNHKSPPQSETEDGDLEIPNATTVFERAQVCALVDVLQTRVDAQMRAVEKARQALGAEEKLFRSLKRRLDRLQSSIAPFHRLPYELIGEITFLCVEAGDSPWELAKVCRSWRSVCLGTPKLWGGLRIILCRKWPLFARYHDGKENCVTTDQLHEALVRSGATPLHLEFLSLKAKGSCSRKKGAKYGETIDQLMDILSHPEHKSRLKSLTVDCDRRWLSYPISETFSRGPFPALEHISLTRSASTLRFTVDIANWAPRLNSAEFRGLWIADVKPTWIEQLRELKFDGLRYAWYSSDFHIVLTLCPSLTSLSLTNVQSVYRSGTDIELFSLVNFEVRHSVIRGRRFVTPALETLIIEKTEWRSSKIKGPRTAQLRNFYWAGFQKDWMLGDVSAHAVDSLSIDMWNGGGWRLLWAWRDDSYFKENPSFPQKLLVKHSGESVPRDNVLENGRFLRVLPGVEEIKIIGIPLGKGVLKELAKEIGPIDREASVFHDGVPRRKGKQPPMCPSAKVLELDMTHVGKKERHGTRNLVRAVLKARRLRSLRCLWDEGGEWEEFCEASM